MFRKKTYFLKSLLFILINILVFNAVYITALIFFLHHPTVEITSAINLRFISVLFNISLIPAIRLMMPIATERTLYQDKTLLITAKASAVQIVIFLVLLWIADIQIFSFVQILLFFCYQVIAVAIIMVIYRMIKKRMLLHHADIVNVIIIGDGLTAATLCEAISKNKEYGYNILGYLGSVKTKDRMHARWIGESIDFETVVEKSNVDEIYYVVENEDIARIHHLVEFCNNNFVKLFFVPAMGQLSLRSYSMAGGSIGFLALRFRGERLDNLFNRAIKRAFDLTVSIIALLVLAVPVLIPTAIAIKLTSRGPILFRQKRNGYHGREFTCYKFRSMVVNNHSNEAATERNDSRITKVGKFIRKTSIDELPQFFNVLIGNMSVVGPRPHIIKQTEIYRNLLNNYMVRHLIKPGITGWAQVNKLRGTAETLQMMEARVKADIWYIENWSLILDIKIVLRTIYNVIFTREENAY